MTRQIQPPNNDNNNNNPLVHLQLNVWEKRNEWGNISALIAAQSSELAKKQMPENLEIFVKLSRVTE